MKTRWGQLAAANAGRTAAMVPVELQAGSVRPDDELPRPGERRRVMTVELGRHYVRLQTIRLRRLGDRWAPDGDLQTTALAAHDRIRVYPRGTR